MEKRVSTLAAAVDAWRTHLDAAAGQSSRLERAISTLVVEIQSWKTDAHKAAARTEAIMLKSLEAIEARLSQSQTREAEIKEALRAAAVSFSSAVEKAQSKTRELAAGANSKLADSLGVLDTRIKQGQQTSELIKKGVQEGIPSLAAKLDGLKDAITETSANTLTDLVKNLGAMEERLVRTQSALEKRVTAGHVSIEKRLTANESATREAVSSVAAQMEKWRALTEEAQHNASEKWLTRLLETEGNLGTRLEALENTSSKANEVEAKNWEKIFRGLELLDSRFATEQAAGSERLESHISAITARLDQWKSQSEEVAELRQTQGLKGLQELEDRLAIKLEGLESKMSDELASVSQNWDTLLRLLKLVHAKLNQNREGLSDELNRAITALSEATQSLKTETHEMVRDGQEKWIAGLGQMEDRLSKRLVALGSKASEGQVADTEYWDKLLRGLEILDTRLSRKQETLAEKVEKATSSLPAKLDQWRIDNEEVVSNSQAELVKGLRGIEDKLLTTLEGIERKALEARLGAGEKWDRLLTRLEVVESKVSEAQAGSGEHWDRLIKVLKGLDARLTKNQEVTLDRVEQIISSSSSQAISGNPDDISRVYDVMGRALEVLEAKLGQTTQATKLAFEDILRRMDQLQGAPSPTPNEVAKMYKGLERALEALEAKVGQKTVAGHQTTEDVVKRLADLEKAVSAIPPAQVASQESLEAALAALMRASGQIEERMQRTLNSFETRISEYVDSSLAALDTKMRQRGEAMVALLLGGASHGSDQGFPKPSVPG